jgi:hypothetical protein
MADPVDDPPNIFRPKRPARAFHPLVLLDAS